MNRFDNGSVSAYTPQSFQELAFVPMMKRQQHDEMVKNLTDLGIIPVDPLDQHRDEALRLKQDLESRLTNLSSDLASKGIDGLGKENFYKLQKERNDLIAPTGRIGRINEAKKLRDVERARFLESASKQYGSTRALELWNNHEKNYTGYEDPEKSKIKYIDSKGIVAAQNFDDDLKTYHSLLGETTRSASNSGYKIKDSGLGDGSMIMVNSSGQTVHSDNISQLNEQRKLLSEKWLKETGEGYKFNDEAGIDFNNFNSRFNSAINMQQKTSDVSKYDQNANFIGGEKEKSSEEDSSIFGEDYKTSEIGGKNSESYSEIRKIGLAKESLFSPKNYHPDKGITVDDIKDVKQKELYNQKWKEATTTGILIDGRKVILKPQEIKKGKNDRKNVEIILKSLEQNPITLTSRLLTANQVLNSQGFVAGLGKNAEDVDKNIRRQLQRDDSSGRKLVDPETGKTITWNEAVDKYDLDDLNNVKYQGQISAHNWENTSFLGSNSKFSPHVITAKDKDGKWYSFQTTRLSSDNIGGNIKRQNDLQENFRTATVSYNNFIPFKSESQNFKGISVKYNPSETEVDEKTGEPKFWTIKFKNGETAKTTESKYMNWVNSIR